MGVVAEPRVGLGVIDDQHLAAGDRVIAEGNAPFGPTSVQSLDSLEALLGSAHDRDECDGNLKESACQRHDGVELRLARRLEDAHVLQVGQTLGLVRRDRIMCSG